MNLIGLDIQAIIQIQYTGGLKVNIDCWSLMWAAAMRYWMAEP
jgi:hypothetical protein